MEQHNNNMRATTPLPNAEAGPSVQSAPERLPIYNEYSRYTGRNEVAARQQSPARRPVGAPHPASRGVSSSTRSMSPAAAAAARSLANAPLVAAPALSRAPLQNEGRHFQQSRRRQEAGEASLLMRRTQQAEVPALVLQRPAVATPPAPAVQAGEQSPFMNRQVPQSPAYTNRPSHGRKNSLAQSFKDLFTPSSETGSGYSTPARVGTDNTDARPSSKSSMIGKVADFFAPDRHNARPGSSASCRQQVSTNSRPASARSLKGFKETYNNYLETFKVEREVKKHKKEREEQIALALKERAARAAEKEAEQKAQADPLATQLTSRLNLYQQEQEAAERRDRARAERVARLDAERATKRQVDVETARRQLEGLTNEPSPASAGSHFKTMSKFINPRPQQTARVSKFHEADDIRITDKPGEYSTPDPAPAPAPQGPKNGKAPTNAPGFFHKMTGATDRDDVDRPDTSDSDMSFADAGAPGMMNACESCGLVPFGPSCLSHGKCSNSRRTDSAYSESTYRDTIDMIDSIAFSRTSYMHVPDDRYCAIRKTTYEDPGNPFLFEKEPLSPLDLYSPSIYSPAEKEHDNQPWRSMSLRRKSYSAIKAAELQTLPESETVTHLSKDLFPEPDRSTSTEDDVQRPAAAAGTETSNEYVPARANWRRASTVNVVRLSVKRDSAFYGFYNEVLEGNGKRDTVAQSMRRRPSYC